MEPLLSSRRRRLTGWLALAPVAAVLSGCGFQLRGAGVQMPFARLLLNAPLGSELTRVLVPQLRSSGVEVMRQTPPQGQPGADVSLDILQDQRERVVVGTTAAGQVRELQLRHRVTFRLRTIRGRDLIQNTELLQERELSFTETQVLGKEEEEALLYTDMRNALVRQLMARLAAVRMP